MNSKVLIIGAYGLLGTTLSDYLKKKKYIVFKAGTSEKSDYTFDASKKDLLEKNIHTINPNYVINLSAITNVDYCESNSAKAFLVNTEIPKNISLLANLFNFKFIHISTDQVYSGKGPHIEEITNPLNIYSKSKLAGEEAVLKCEGIILRTNFVGKSKTEDRISFTDWLFANAKNNLENMTLFDDVFFNPIHIDELCNFIYIVLQNFKSGIFNVGSSDSISKAEFGLQFLKKFEFRTSLISITSIEDSKLKAVRPKDMSMNINKTAKNFNWIAPSMNNTISSCIEEYIN